MLFLKVADQDNIPLKLPSLQLNGNIIGRENLLTFFGFILDEQSTWKKCLQVIDNKASSIQNK